jgi:UDP-glucose 4-epimerase
MRMLVVGGAGFIGSHLVDKLIERGHNVVCVDDLSLGKKEFIEQHISKRELDFVELDATDTDALNKVFGSYPFDCVFHLAANSDIQAGLKDTQIDLQRTFMTTYSILGCMGKNNVKNIVFASSSAIYGELNINLREDSGPLFPISFYGAAKLACEAYIAAASANFHIKSWIIRFPNVVGERMTHGVIFDFIDKLRNNPKELVILGNGEQRKHYLYVKDMVDAILFAWEHSNEKVNCFNVAAESTTTVTRIAEIVVEEMGLSNVNFRYTGGDRGWTGDVPRFTYDITKILRLGWRPGCTSDEAVRKAVRLELKRRQD